MTIWLVTRHAGAADWLSEQGLGTAKTVEHLDVHAVQPGDHVVGTLPINIVASLNIKGVRYFHLTITVPPEQRGIELTAEQMKSYGARIEEYAAERLS